MLEFTCEELELPILTNKDYIVYLKSKRYKKIAKRVEKILSELERESEAPLLEKLKTCKGHAYVS